MSVMSFELFNILIKKKKEEFISFYQERNRLGEAKYHGRDDTDDVCQSWDWSPGLSEPGPMPFPLCPCSLPSMCPVMDHQTSLTAA